MNPMPLRSRITRTGPGRYRIMSDRATGRTYTVDVRGDTGHCNCQGFASAARNNNVCKHVRQCIEEERKYSMTTNATEERTAEHEAVADERALTPIKILPQQAIVPTGDEFDGMKRLSKHLVTARGLTVPKALDTPSKVLTVVYAGWELGVKPMTALRHIHLIQGRVEPSAQLKMGIVMAAEPDARFEILESTAQRALIRFVRPSRGIVQEFEYTIEDAKLSGQAGKDGPWKTYPKDMLRWAAINRICRLWAADLINSVTSGLAAGVAGFGADEAPDDDDARDDDADMIDAETTELYNDGDSPDAPTEHDDDAPTEELTPSQQMAARLEATFAALTPAKKKQLADELNAIIPDKFNTTGLRMGQWLTDNEIARVREHLDGKRAGQAPLMDR